MVQLQPTDVPPFADLIEIPTPRRIERRRTARLTAPPLDVVNLSAAVINIGLGGVCLRLEDPERFAEEQKIALRDRQVIAIDVEPEGEAADAEIGAGDLRRRRAVGIGQLLDVVPDDARGDIPGDGPAADYDGNDDGEDADSFHACLLAGKPSPVTSTRLRGERGEPSRRRAARH